MTTDRVTCAHCNADVLASNYNGFYCNRCNGCGPRQHAADIGQPQPMPDWQGFVCTAASEAEPKGYVTYVVNDCPHGSSNRHGIRQLPGQYWHPGNGKLF